MMEREGWQVTATIRRECRGLVQHATERRTVIRDPSETWEEFTRRAIVGCEGVFPLEKVELRFMGVIVPNRYSEPTNGNGNGRHVGLSHDRVRELHV